MAHKIYKLLLLFLTATLAFSCSEEDEPDISGIDFTGDNWEKSALDNWLYENFVVPYNIEVKYRFDRYEVPLDRVLAPVMEDKVIPVMEAIKHTWIDPYEAEGGSTFIKRLSPKQFVLIGSASYNDNGTITLGTAEGGRKILLFVINQFSKSDKEEVRQMLHTIHHEFAHILHQTVMYPQAFQNISTGYTASWNDFSLADARSRGFITEYARSSPNEDFVEMVSIMLIEGKAGFDAIVNSQPAEAREDFREKEQLVVRYFKETWNIDFYSLQARTQTAINTL
ncbi:zinc-binding metallopeptidase [Botryobacter ruber]|uniref:zinc-binding metallopeptidase n=1 Tax=Botryobacter ruber TaxID=2171629 RepID=UPI000E0CB297|nr:putative zinc-binding metallopeptidase [Botryobacter ruber]